MLNFILPYICIELNLHSNDLYSTKFYIKRILYIQLYFEVKVFTPFCVPFLSYNRAFPY
jgi:hypothetical protein